MTRKQAALDRLKVSEKQLSSVPNITRILKETYGGRRLAFEAMQFSDQPLIKKFLDKYRRIPDRDRISLPIEAIAIAAKIDVRHLWGEIMLAMREVSVNTVKTLAVSEHPEVMKKRIEFAKLPAGVRDRDALDTMLGALPQANGNTFINRYFASPSDGKEVAESKPEMVDDLEFIFPEPSILQEKVAPIRKFLHDGANVEE